MYAIHNLVNKKDVRKKLRRSATPQEVILWSRIKNKQLGRKFRRQHSIGQYIVDFYCSEKKLVIELDGSQHIEKQKDYDDMRSKYLENLGFTVLRFWDNEVNKNIEGVLLKILDELS